MSKPWLSDDSGDPARLRLLLDMVKHTLAFDNAPGKHRPLRIQQIHQHGGGLVVTWDNDMVWDRKFAGRVAVTFARAWAFIDTGRMPPDEDLRDWLLAIDHDGCFPAGDAIELPELEAA